jgi:hypothetical protein
MNLYIEIENGVAINHPAYEDNLIDALGSVPAHWEAFTRVEQPEPALYQTFDSPRVTYQKVNGVWSDVWMLRDMSDAEKAAKQQITKDAWAVHPNAENLTAWTFDEATNTMVPPIPRPAIDQTKLDARILTMWCGADNNWKDTPVRPEGDYKFDFIAWEWVVVTTS